MGTVSKGQIAALLSSESDRSHRCPQGSHTYRAFTLDTCRPGKTHGMEGHQPPEGCKVGFRKAGRRGRAQGGATVCVGGEKELQDLLGAPRGTEVVRCMQRAACRMAGRGSWRPGWPVGWAEPRRERGGGVRGRNLAGSTSAESGGLHGHWAAGPRPAWPLHCGHRNGCASRVPARPDATQ